MVLINHDIVNKPCETQPVTADETANCMWLSQFESSSSRIKEHQGPRKVCKKTHFFLFDPSQVPEVAQPHLESLPVFQKHGSPQSHEDGKEDGGWIVKQMTGPCSPTGWAEVPIVTGLVTQGTHGEGILVVTHLFAGNIFLDCCTSIKKHNHAYDRRWDQEWCIQPQPSKI